VLSSHIALNGTGQQALEHAQLQPGMTYVDVGISHPNRDAFVHQFFNTAAFVPLSQMQLGTYGNAGRNFMNEPSLINTDFTLMRDFPESHRRPLQHKAGNRLRRTDESVHRRRYFQCAEPQ